MTDPRIWCCGKACTPPGWAALEDVHNLEVKRKRKGTKQWNTKKELTKLRLMRVDRSISKIELPCIKAVPFSFSLFPTYACRTP